MIEKRYQTFGKNGLEWSKWFNYSYSGTLERWQLKGKLRNEYREVTEDGEVRSLSPSGASAQKNKRR